MPTPAPAPTTSASAPAVLLEGVHRAYPNGRGTVHALADVTLALAPGSFTAVMGPSGSDKSSLLNCAAGLDTPTSGRVVVGGADLTTMSADALTRLPPRRGVSGACVDRGSN